MELTEIDKPGNISFLDKTVNKSTVEHRINQISANLPRFLFTRVKKVMLQDITSFYTTLLPIKNYYAVLDPCNCLLTSAV